MTHQHVTAALATAESLRESWQTLLTLDTTTSDDGLKAWRPGTGVTGGGTTNGVDDLLLRRGGQQLRYLRLDEQAQDAVNDSAWLLRSALPDHQRTTHVTLDQIVAWLPDADPTTARDVDQRLTKADRAIRRALRLNPADRLPRDPDGNRIGTADQLAQILTTPQRPISASRIRDWARRSRKEGDRLFGMLPVLHVNGPRRGDSWHRLDHAVEVAQTTSKGEVRFDHTLEASRRPMPVSR